MSEDPEHDWSDDADDAKCLRCGCRKRYLHGIDGQRRSTLPCMTYSSPPVSVRFVVDCTQRSGTRPRTVEVGMVLCRPADGYCANSWRVKGVTGPDARVRRLDADYEDIGLLVAIAAILHESGGWVLAEDWTKPEAT